MKPLAIALVLLVFFAVEACSTTRGRRSSPPPPPPPPETSQIAGPAPTPVAPSTPVAPPTPTAATLAPDDPSRTMPLKTGMQKVSDAALQDSLEEWADGKEVDLKHVIKRTGVFLEVWPKVRWTDAKKRETNPADYDRLVNESYERSKKLMDAAVAGKTDQIKHLSDELVSRCVDCHTKYK